MTPAQPSIKELLARNEQLRAALAAEVERTIEAFWPATVPASQPTIEPAGGLVAGKESTWKL